MGYSLLYLMSWMWLLSWFLDHLLIMWRGDFSRSLTLGSCSPVVVCVLSLSLPIPHLLFSPSLLYYLSLSLSCCSFTLHYYYYSFHVVFSLLPSSSALVLQAIFILLCAYFGTTKLLALLLLTLTISVGGLQLAGHAVAMIEMAPRYAGIIMGLANTAGTLPGIIGPIITKQIAHAVSCKI